MENWAVVRKCITRSSQRLAQKSRRTYGQLVLRLRQGQVTDVDETGWKIGGHAAWLWVFTNDEVSVYVIAASRAHEVVEQILTQDYAGVMVCDCFLAYDPLRYAQSKCPAHLLRRCKELQESQSGHAVEFSHQVARLLRAALTLKGRGAQMSARGYWVACGRLEAALDRLLERNHTNADNARLAKLLRKQRHRLLIFLYHDAVAPTNNAAERELRPAVVVRKTGACNRTPKGADAHAILASVIRTCHKHAYDLVELIKHLLRSAEAVILDLTAPKSSATLLPPAIAPHKGATPVNHY